MDPAGFAIGVVSLVGLFSTCLEVVEKVDAYKDFGRDSRALATQFDANKHRLEEWGRAVGIEKGKLSDTHHPALDDPKKLAIVYELLASIHDFHGGSDDTQQPPLAGIKIPTDGSLFTRQSQHYHSAPADSKGRKLTWALTGKKKRTGHVQTFETLVGLLYNVVPPGVTDTTLSGHEMRNHGPGNLHDTSLNEGSWLSDIQTILRTMKEDNIAETKRDLHTWLGCPSPNDLYDESIQKRLDTTCEWIFERDNVRNWLLRNIPAGISPESQVLWINGPAGFGKTILCAKLVEFLLSNLSTPVAHFFLSSKFEGRDDPFVAIRSWIAQVAFRNDTALDVVCAKRLAQYEQVATRATILRIFREVLQTVPSCIFVLDGLDECTGLGENRNGSDSVAYFLNELRQAIDNTTARILVVSRNEPEIRQGLLEFFGFSKYAISPEDVRADNIAYSRDIVNKKLPNKNEVMRLSISQKMADRCNGQFQWLKMQEALLRKGKNQKQLEKDIDETPEGLDHLYDRNWERIEGLRSVEKSRAFSLLRWAAFALRPLTVCEITEAVLINDDCDNLPLDEMPDPIDDDYIESEILGLCGSLIEVQGAPSESTAGSKKIYLAHFSVKQYLLCKIPPQGAVLTANESLRISNEAIENITLAKLCLRYISFQGVWKGSAAKEEKTGTSFRSYAAGSWYQHVDMSVVEDKELVDAINVFFDGHIETWESWRQWFDVNDEDFKPEEIEEVIPPGPLYYASRLGLTGVVRHLIQGGKNGSKEKSKSERSALGVACERGKFEITEMLLEMGEDVDIRGYRGLTPLYSASMNGHLKVAKLLLKNGADITVPNKNGWTPLHSASSNGYLEIVQLLLDKGADIKVPDKDGWTPLHLASSDGYLEIVRLLLDKGADIEIPDNNGRRPLHLASFNGHLEIVKLLLDKGADIEIPDNNGWRPLHLASFNGYLEIVRLLLDKGADIEIPNNNGIRPLDLASFKGYLEVVKLLLDKGADIEIPDNNGWRPLHSASFNGYLEIVRLLLDKGADIEIPDNNGWRPLYLASSYGYLEIVRLLLDKGADIKVPDKDGWIPLHSASFYGYLEIVQLLLDKGVDIEIPDNNGGRPLHSASFNGHLEVVKLLLDKGADIEIPDNNGGRPLHSASFNGHLEVVRLLLDKGADIEIPDNNGIRPLDLASFKGYLEVVKLLLDKGADIEIPDNNRRRPLHSASFNGHLEIVRLLLDKGADIEIPDNNGGRPLHSASFNGHLEIVRLLLDKGADIEIPDNNGGRPLDSASFNGHLEVVKLLLDKGADIETTSNGWIPLKLASHNGHLEVVKLLQDIGLKTAKTKN